jgi:methionine-rich copper-binding protein CopC
MRRTPLWIGAFVTATTAAAWAHAFLERSNPGAGAILAAPPKILTLDFSEQLEPAFSDVTVSDTNGRAVTSASDNIAGTRMSVTLPALKPGSYKVTWHALSVDTHRTQGSFSFTVKP